MKNITTKWILAILFTFGLIMPSMVVAQAGDTPPDQQTILQNYSLFSEYYKNENLEESLKYLKWIEDNWDAVLGVNAIKSRIKTLQFRRIRTYERLAESLADAEKCEVINQVFDLKNEEMSILKDNGVPEEELDDELEQFENRLKFIHSNLDCMPDENDNLREYYNQYFEMAPEKVDDFYIMYEIEQTLREIQQKTDEFDTDGAYELKGVAIKLMEEREQFLDELENQEKIEAYRGALFNTPEERIAFLESQLEKKGEDLNIMEELFELYRREGNNDKAMSMGNRLAGMNPSFRLYRILGKFEFDNGNMSQALEYFDKAINMPEATPQDKADLLYIKAANYLQSRQYQSAYNTAGEVLQYDGNHSAAGKMRNDALASMAGECCGGNLACRAIYWTIPGYGRYAPTREQYFLSMGWTPGQRVAVGGCMSWTGRSATVQ